MTTYTDEQISRHAAKMRRQQAKADSDALKEIIEIYAGMDGFIPETCGEGYLQRIIKQMYEAAIQKKMEGK